MNQPDQLEKEPQTLWSCLTFLNISNISRQRAQEICFCGFRVHVALRELVMGPCCREVLCEQHSLYHSRKVGRGWRVEVWCPTAQIPEE